MAPALALCDTECTRSIKIFLGNSTYSPSLDKLRLTGQQDLLQISAHHLCNLRVGMVLDALASLVWKCTTIQNNEEMFTINTPNGVLMA